MELLSFNSKVKNSLILVIIQYLHPVNSSILYENFGKKTKLQFVQTNIQKK